MRAVDLRAKEDRSAVDAQLRAPASLPDEAAERPASDDPSIDAVLEAERLRERARAVLARLPEKYSFLLLWRYWEQKSTRDIAATLGAVGRREAGW